MSWSDTIVVVVFSALWIAILGYVIWRGVIARRRVFRPLDLPEDQAVVIAVHGGSVDPRYFRGEEFAHVANELQIALGNIGQVQPAQIGERDVTIEVLGESADEMYDRLGSVLRHSSLAANARVSLRYGPVGSAERRLHMAN